MKISQFSNHYQVRKLTEADLEQVLVLYQTNPLYFEHYPPSPSLEGLRQDLVNCPPGKDLSDKYFVGYWWDNQLVAVLYLIASYPDDQIAYIGLFMVDGSWAGQGIGSKIMAELESQLGQYFQKVRLGYVAANPQASRFWQKQGFERVAEKTVESIQICIAEKTRVVK